MPTVLGGCGDGPQTVLFSGDLVTVWTDGPVLLCRQSLEAAVTDPGRSYSDRVATLLSSWEKLAAMTARASRDALLVLAQHIYRSVTRTLSVSLLS